MQRVALWALIFLGFVVQGTALAGKAKKKPASAAEKPAATSSKKPDKKSDARKKGDRKAPPLVHAQVAVADCWAEPDLRPEAVALSIMVRSLVGKNLQVEWSTMVEVAAGPPDAPPLPDGRPAIYLNSREAKGLLPRLNADYLVTWNCSTDGVSFVATVHLNDAQGMALDRATFTGLRSDLPALGKAIARRLDKVLAVNPDLKKVASFGSLRPYVRAERALLRKDPQAAALALLGVDPRVARELPAAANVARTLWNDPERPPMERLQTAVGTATPEELLALCDGLRPGDAPADYEEPPEVVGVRALALIEQGKLPEAEKLLAAPRLGAFNEPLLLYARVRLAFAQKKPEAFEQPLGKLIQIRNLTLLRWIASLPPGSFTQPVEQDVLAAASAIKERDAALAGALGLRAALGSKSAQGLELVTVNLLGAGQEVQLAGLLVTVPATETTLKLRAELRLRNKDYEGAEKDALAALALRKGKPNDLDLALLLGRIYVLEDKLDLAAEQLALASKQYVSAGYELARVQRKQKKDAEAKKTYASLGADPTSVEQYIYGGADVLTGHEDNTEYEQLKKIIRLKEMMMDAPQNSDLLKSMAIAFRTVGDVDKAGEMDKAQAELLGDLENVEEEALVLGDPEKLKTEEEKKAAAKPLAPVLEPKKKQEESSWMWILLIALGGVVVIGAIVVAIPFVLGGGEVQMKLEMDPLTSKRTYCARLTKQKTVPEIKDPAKWAEKTTMRGVRIHARSQTLINETTKFDAFPGEWFLQVWGTHVKDGELVVLHPVIKPVKINRGWNTVTEVDLRPSLVEVIVTVTSGNGPVLGAKVWADEAKTRTATGQDGKATLKLAEGSRLIHVEAAGRVVDRPIVVGSIQVEVTVRVDSATALSMGRPTPPSSSKLS